MNKHPLHKVVGDLLKEFAEKNNYEAIRAPECGGDKNIPLFREKKSNDQEMCNVDAILLKDNKVVVVIEIEESNIKPTHICGKYLATALSKRYIPNTESNAIELDNKSVNFIQILDTKSLKQASKKPIQFNNIKEDLKRNLCGCIKNYEIISINSSEEGYNAVLKKNLYEVLRDY